MDWERKRILDEWYQVHSDAIFKYICLISKDYQQAEDLTQETFIKAYHHMDNFQKKAQVRTWLFRIAHNVTIDYLRKRKPLRVFEAIFHQQVERKALPEEQLIIQEEVRELYQALEKLKPAHREVIILRKIKGFSIKETSTILNWSENKVKITLHRAMPVFKQALKSEEE
ncbi:sigma-70 family RNA polymerase sigma factor [Gracilibacillus salitolerans]|uniref:RNA polymerase sigma factor n=1 Tax=Gracilibacillus salitolerans TaxID=2663022 RepID=A0A5Q2TNP7_9BACI|nr:RNA polymerase sigma factor [Gracilibacillus salitolerans]QGH35480.1 sigma-70 family RNA polymerase sigma factor [Gracilibacillus salitolerans]